MKKNYHVAVASAIGIDTMIISFEGEITMENIRLFGDKALVQANKQAGEDLMRYNPKVISWQEIK